MKRSKLAGCLQESTGSIFRYCIEYPSRDESFIMCDFDLPLAINFIMFSMRWEFRVASVGEYGQSMINIVSSIQAVISISFETTLRKILSNSPMSLTSGRACIFF